MTMDNFVEVEDQDIQVSFAIAVPYDIPGNGKEKLIDLKSYDIKADFKYYSIPKLSDETYLIATLSDTVFPNCRTKPTSSPRCPITKSTTCCPARPR